MSEMISFYGGRQGNSINIVKHFDGIDIPKNTIYRRYFYAIDLDGNFILTTQSEGGNVEVSDGIYLISKNSDNFMDYIWKLQLNNGENINNTDYTFPLEYAEGMIQCFKQGTQTVNQVGYGEYVIIDTLFSMQDTNNLDNGKLFRRGLDIQSDLAGAEYVGQIIGPKGEVGPAGGIHIIKNVNSLDELKDEKGNFIPPERLVDPEGKILHWEAAGWSCTMTMEDSDFVNILAYDYKLKIWYPIGSINTNFLTPQAIITKSTPNADKMPENKDIEKLNIDGYWFASEQATFVD